eukprot:11324039-Alexandrium_andersonii.AAC.1
MQGGEALLPSSNSMHMAYDGELRDGRTGHNIASGFGGKNATRALTWAQIRDDGIFYRCYIR